ncbi:MAG TPA: PqqD family protein [Victivallales bacterium]|nr:PqqD family protein [Victivallales bacterium]HPO91211.1 PqqD family protein [Victivallales bacterium]HRR29305.1 PqqD family protein [Victivallales bacterium]HRU02436.1 PqqD family protein [Victivallales bacterium]
MSKTLPNEIINREEALRSIPIKTPILKSEFKEKKLYLTFEFERPKWQQLLGSEKKCQKTFALDTIGTEIYQLCDGKNSVQNIITEFSEKYKVNKAEAELAVTKFLKTLIEKNIIIIQINHSTKINNPKKENKY